MASLAINRLESLLQTRKLDVTLARPWVVPPALGSTGVTGLDDALGGGWRRGEISEITGTRSSGRTSLLVATLAAAAGRGEVVGLVDTFDRFDPLSAAASGLDLDAMLWVRGVPISDTATAVRRPATRESIVETAVQRAIRACDLIIRAGGFGVVALDLADVPARALRSLPWTTWRRLAHAIEGRDTIGLLLSEMPLSRSARGVSLRLDATSRWSGDSAQSRRYRGASIIGRGPFGAVEFQTRAVAHELMFTSPHEIACERAARASRASGAGIMGPCERARQGGAAGTKSPRI